MMPSEDPSMTTARCPNGHGIRMWGGPLYVKKGEVPNMWGNPITCGTCEQKLGVQ